MCVLECVGVSVCMCVCVWQKVPRARQRIPFVSVSPESPRATNWNSFIITMTLPVQCGHSQIIIIQKIRQLFQFTLCFAFCQTLCIFIKTNFKQTLAFAS